MTPSEQIAAFDHEIRSVITRFRREFELPYASAVGVLEMAKWDLIKEGNDSLEDE